MAAVLELLLQDEVGASSVVRWVKASQSSCAATMEENQVHSKLALLNLLQKDFVPFLLNYLREQTSQMLTNGPSTPAKTPNSKLLSSSASYRTQRMGSERRSHNITGSSSSRGRLFFDTTAADFHVSETSVSASESQGSSVISGSCTDFRSLDSSSSLSFGSSPTFSHNERRSTQKANLGSFLVATPVRRGRRKGNSPASTSGQLVAQDVGRIVNEELRTDNSSRQKKKNEMRIASPSSPPDQLNLNDLEEFPPMNAAGMTNKAKPSRRINPTPVSTERTFSKPKKCFTSTPLGQAQSLHLQCGTSPEMFVVSPEGNMTSLPSSLQEEREMLKKERSKLLHHASPSSGLSLEASTSTKINVGRSTSLSAENHWITSADVNKVSCRKQLEKLAQVYSYCITENLVPNIFLELFFVLQLLTSRGTSCGEDEEESLDLSGEYKDAVGRQHFQTIHNCVYFAVQVLGYQFQIISHLDKGTLKLLAENDRITSFSNDLHDKLVAAYESSTAKVSLLLPSCVQSVSFQPETDNRSNFSTDKAFHIFKKQRDIFYELLREWEDNCEKTGWDFEKCLGERIRDSRRDL